MLDGKSMQRRPDYRATNAARSRRTRRVSPASLNTPLTSDPAVIASAQPPRTTFLLLCLGIFLAFLYLAFDQLLATNGLVTDRMQPIVLVPWLPVAQWEALIPASWWVHVPWLNPTYSIGHANLSLFLLSLAMLCVLLATLPWRRRTFASLIPAQTRAIFWTLFLFAALFAAVMLYAPVSLSVTSQDMLLAGLYGRMVVYYHVNPYATTAPALPLDTLQQLLASIRLTSANVPAVSFGPVWTDLSILVTLAARNNIPAVLLGFRLIGLVAHLSNVALIWFILAKLKPEIRLSATLFYAWNPLVLVLGVSQMHLEIVLVFFVLLAVYFFQRDSLILSWVLVLLAALVNLSCLLLLPLFLRMVAHKIRFLSWWQRFWWWLGLVVISGLVIVLSYIPYWQGWGLSGLESSLLQAFWQNKAVNSFDAAILNVPIRFPARVMWPFMPHHWTALLLLVVIGVLLFALWLADTIELVLVCGSGLLLLFIVLQPVYWPWYVILPLPLALCSAHRYSIQLAVLLVIGALLSYYFWLLRPVWVGQGLITVGVPCLLWGWIVFFNSSWQRAYPDNTSSMPDSRPLRLVRPPWLSRPSWPSRPSRRGIK